GPLNEPHTFKGAYPGRRRKKVLAGCLQWSVRSIEDRGAPINARQDAEGHPPLGYEKDDGRGQEDTTPNGPPEQTTCRESYRKKNQQVPAVGSGRWRVATRPSDCGER